MTDSSNIFWRAEIRPDPDPTHAGSILYLKMMGHEGLSQTAIAEHAAVRMTEINSSIAIFVAAEEAEAKRQEAHQQHLYSGTDSSDHVNPESLGHHIATNTVSAPTCDGSVITLRGDIKVLEAIKDLYDTSKFSWLQNVRDPNIPLPSSRPTKHIESASPLRLVAKDGKRLDEEPSRSVP